MKNYPAGISTMTKPKAPLATPTPARLVNNLRILEVKTTLPGDEEGRDRFFFQPDRPFHVEIIVDLSGVSPHTPLQFRALVMLRQVGSVSQVIKARAQGTILADDTALICTPVSGLPEGTYRLENVVYITLDGDQLARRGRLEAMSEGKMLRVISSETAWDGNPEDADSPG